MSQDRVMLLIDADNVSVDVIEQAVALLLEQHGALHLRRAYCTAESALKHQAVFKRLGIKPMVNLSAGKNSTDIALAVDAVDLVLAERPEVVVIASSDSDFAPLVQRLREKGCRVRGIGQQGKTGDETQQAYDDFTVLAHKPAARAAVRAGAAAAAAPQRAASAPVPAVAPKPSRSARPTRTTAAKAAAAVATAPPAPAAPPAPPASAAPAARSAAQPATKPAAKRATRPAAKAATAHPGVGTTATPSTASLPAAASDELGRVLACLPELQRGQKVELRVAADRLREAGLISASGSPTKLLRRHAPPLELLPAGQPNHVRLQPAAAAR